MASADQSLDLSDDEIDQIKRAEGMLDELGELLRDLEQRLFAFESGLVTVILIKQVEARIHDLRAWLPALLAIGHQGASIEARLVGYETRILRVAERVQRIAEGKADRIQEGESAYREIWGDYPDNSRPLDERLAFGLVKGCMAMLWAARKHPELTGVLGLSGRNLLDLSKELKSHMPRAPLSDPPPKPKR